MGEIRGCHYCEGSRALAHVHLCSAPRAPFPPTPAAPATDAAADAVADAFSRTFNLSLISD